MIYHAAAEVWMGRDSSSPGEAQGCMGLSGVPRVTHWLCPCSSSLGALQLAAEFSYPLLMEQLKGTVAGLAKGPGYLESFGVSNLCHKPARAECTSQSRMHQLEMLLLQPHETPPRPALTSPSQVPRTPPQCC